MFHKHHHGSGHSQRKGWPFLYRCLLLLIGFLPLQSFAHPSPNSLVFLDVSPSQVRMEVQLPVPELELAFGNDISKDPATVVERFGPQLKEYLLAHIHAYARKDQPWLASVTGLKMDKGAYADSNIPYWEVNASITLTPQAGEDGRHFFLDYDVIMHQVINHAALVSIRSDWETGALEKKDAEVQAIGWNLQDNIIPPLQVNLGKGSWWKGFGSMVRLGIRHISEGTDHLMFLLVLLLPAPLIARNGKWGQFGGTRYSVFRLLKIVTAFTIGHSITLLLGSLGWVRLPTQPVEVLIAFSILVSAVHALRPLFPGREMFVAAGFGLIHGMAFAATLAHLNLKAGPMALSILGFNAGIELMQLFIIAITVPWLIILSKRSVYRYVRITGAAVALVAASAWMVQRTTGKGNVIADTVESLAANARWLIFALAIIALSTFLWRDAGKTVLKKV